MDILSQLSIVIITKNEENHISSCINSVLMHAKTIKGRVLLVDSHSSDHTIQVAAKYPIKIVQLSDKASLTPSAGRYVGYLLTTTPYILFIDGDMILQPHWVSIALRYLRTHPTIAAISGMSMEKRNASVVPLYKQYGYVPYIFGSFMLRRELINRLQLFHPFLQGNEEQYMCFKLANDGFKLYRTREINVIHLGYKQNLTSKLKRVKYSVGIGQTIRTMNHRNRQKIITKLGWRCGLYITMLILVVLFGMSLITKSIVLFVMFLSINVVIYLLAVFRTHDFKRSIFNMINYYGVPFAIIIGFIKGLPPLSKISMNYIIVK